MRRLIPLLLLGVSGALACTTEAPPPRRGEANRPPPPVQVERAREVGHMPGTGDPMWVKENDESAEREAEKAAENAVPKGK